MIHPDTILTRYLVGFKFESLLDNGLYLSKVSEFPDDLEGILPYILKKNTDPFLNKTEIQNALQWVYASCWYEGEKESQKMWDDYARDPKSVAIRIRARSLVQLYFSESRNMQSYFDSILYKNPLFESFKNHRSITVLTSHLANEGYPTLIYTSLFSYYKHTDYEYENEVRLVTVDSDAKRGEVNPKKGIILKIDDLNNFIDKIILSPYATFESRRHIESIRLKYNIRKPILDSSLKL